jgi:hypothetical protein
MTEFTFRKLRVADLNSLYDIYSETASESDKVLYYSDRSVESFFRNLNDGGIYIGAFLANRLIGYSGVTFPVNAQMCISRAAGIACQVIPLMAEFDGSCVLRHYRGRGLQLRLSEMRTHASIRCGRPFSVGVVADHNTWSLKNFMRFGMKVRGILDKEDTSAWYVIVGDHARSMADSYEEIIDVQYGDLPRLRRAFSAGYEAFAVDRANDEDVFKLGRNRVGGLDVNSIERFNQTAIERELNDGT